MHRRAQDRVVRTVLVYVTYCDCCRSFGTILDHVMHPATRLGQTAAGTGSALIAADGAPVAALAGVSSVDGLTVCDDIGTVKASALVDAASAVDDVIA
jgi:hypothetical protein